MTSRGRLGIGIGAVALALVVVGLGAAFRSHLGGVPLIGRLIGPAGTLGDRTPMYVCPMHPEVRQSTPGTCPLCRMDLVLEAPAGTDTSHDHGAAAHPASDATTTPRAGITLDLRRQQLVGVRVADAAIADLSRTIRAAGIVRYDETRQADVTLKVEGWIEDLYVDHTGQPVARGQPLFTIYSPDLVATQQEYLLALRTRDRMRTSEVTDARDTADRLVAATRQRLMFWDLPADLIDAIEVSGEVRTAVLFRSPVSGLVVVKRAVKGMRVMPGEMLYKVADLSVVWLEADVYERELALVRRGTRAEVTLDAYPGERFTGRLTYVYPAVDERTRTGRVRLELANPGGRLKPGMFANVSLTSPAARGLVVPADALVDSGTEQYVFVALGEGFFEPRRVEIGQRLAGRVEVVKGLRAGDRVASGATFFLDSESQLRAAMQGFDDLPSLDEGAPRGDGGAAVDVTFRTQPDPPRHGDSTFLVRLRDEHGEAITDADVTVRLYMAPMPSMNMPAMRVEARLLHIDGGLYRGHGTVTMAGRWDVTVAATRGGARLVSRQFAIVAQ
jgi:multidrug efflux pump subunit AcrA (membrane-fusion protein)